jgi:hypothetical protein
MIRQLCTTPWLRLDGPGPSASRRLWVSPPQPSTQVRNTPHLVKLFTDQAGLTFAYSHMVVPPIVAHAPEKLLAKQWLQAYQYASTFVPPLIISGTLSNVYLACSAYSIPIRLLYTFASVLSFSIIPWTLFVFEPNVNGSGKWKVQKLLQDEGYHMPMQKGLLPSPEVHTANSGAKQWAESVTMKEIAQTWAHRNKWRYIATGTAMTMSAIATYAWLSGILP